MDEKLVIEELQRLQKVYHKDYNYSDFLFIKTKFTQDRVLSDHVFLDKEDIVDGLIENGFHIGWLTLGNIKNQLFENSNVKYLKKIIPFIKEDKVSSDFLDILCCLKEDYLNIFLELLNNLNNSHIRHIISNNKIEYANHILDKIDINKDNNWLMRNACMFGNFEIVKLLVENGADICSEALDNAKKYEHLEILEYLQKR